MSILEPSPEEQRRILECVAGFIVDHAAGIARLPVAVRADRDAIRRQLDAVGVETATDAGAVIDRVVALLTDGMVHTGHPRYFGLFNPAPSFMGIVAELIVAAFNPQLAAWSHAPAAVEMEAWTIDYLADRCGLDGPVGGSFTSGGAEANASALHLALTRAIPDMATAGLAAPGVRPTLYASSESHLAWLKIAHVSGVGRDAVRLVPTDARLRMDPDALRRLMAEDTAAGHRPVLIVGTAGTTSAGVVDPLTELAGIA
ncbi:MAG TPA: pyridoxal-dependent decarboxylase, partial [Acidimicrobiales bacterium]|nr:pyridoxal-dependent decarboxylase [Acidimicrobiales bacterium]